MEKAALRIAIANDVENDVVKGCRLAEKGVIARFANKDGQPTEVKITDDLVNDILSLANASGRLDAYWTHDRLSDKTNRDHIHDSIGVWRNFRKDENGNPIADLHLEPSEHKDKILWKAQNDPDGIMCSLVFAYEGGKDDARAKQIYSGDLVRFGAATTALLSAFPDSLSDNSNSIPMTPEELINLLNDPNVAGAIKDMFAGYEKQPHEEAGMMEEYAAMEKSAGVTDEDKMDSDKEKSKEVASMHRIIRAQARQMAALKTEIAKSVDEASTKAQAAMVAKLGRSGGSTIQVGGETKTFKDLVAAELATMQKKDASVAMFAAIRKFPDAYNKARRNGEI